MLQKTISDLSDKALQALQTSPIYPLRLLRVEELDDALVISGHVPTFYCKQLAQEAVRAIAPDRNIINNIDVFP